MHLDEEQLQRVLHDELKLPGEASVRDHLTACEGCQERVRSAARAEERLFVLLQTIDRPVPAKRTGDVLRFPRGRSSTWFPRAAAVIAGLAIGAAAYAAPGFPVRGLLRRFVPQRIDRSPVPGAGFQAESRAALSPVGIAVSPGERLTIDVAQVPAASAATVSLVDGGEVIVRAVGGLPTFRSEINRLAIENSATVSELSMEVPRDAPFVEIRVGGRRVWRKTGAEISGGTTDSTGRYLLTVNP